MFQLKVRRGEGPHARRQLMTHHAMACSSTVLFHVCVSFHRHQHRTAHAAHQRLVCCGCGLRAPSTPPPPAAYADAPPGVSLLHLQGLGAWTHFAHQVAGLKTPEIDSFVKAAVFSTLTNVRGVAAG